jgi:NADH:ubiquinone oxidoreductase subunit 5 (subunit L)/multisubunit Na+/H+ antiporter MnhA subunit
VIGAVGKSAQIGLHLWLPDAMEGPTPVSALIHAATMVTAGLYLLIRCSFILVLVPSVFYIIVILGSCTVVFSSLVALVQYDLKKIIAYSTCSQLGYMFLTIGLSNFTLSYYHLLTHAYFKALLFLTAGSIIHFFNGEQDIRKLGGLLKIAPYYYLVFLIGNLSLFGFFFTSGFYSKENLLSFVLNSSNNSYVYFCSLLALIMTACTILYSIRLFYYLFFNNTNSFYSMYIRLSKLNVATNELYVLLFLALCSIIVGYLYQDLFLENSLFFSSSIASEHITIFTADFMPAIIKLLPFFFYLLLY